MSVYQMVNMFWMSHTKLSRTLLHLSIQKLKIIYLKFAWKFVTEQWNFWKNFSNTEKDIVFILEFESQIEPGKVNIRTCKLFCSISIWLGPMEGTVYYLEKCNFLDIGYVKNKIN